MKRAGLPRLAVAACSNWGRPLLFASLCLTSCKQASDSSPPADHDRTNLEATSPTAIFGDAVIEYWDARQGTTVVDGHVTAWAGQVRGTTVNAPDPASTTGPTVGPDGSAFNGQSVIQCGPGQRLTVLLPQPLVPSGTRPYFAWVGRLQSAPTKGGNLVSFDHTPPPDAQGDAGVHVRVADDGRWSAYYRMGGLSPEVEAAFNADTDPHVFEHELRPDIGVVMTIDGARATQWTQSVPFPLWYVRPALQAGLDTVSFCPGPGETDTPVSIAQVVLLSAPPTAAQRAAYLSAVKADLGQGYCGDGQPGGREQCDDGNSVDGDECRNDCTHRMCGGGQDQTCPPGCPNGQCGAAALDRVSVQPIAAFSVADRLNSSYRGPAFRLRRSSDGAEANIGFGEQNHVDPAQASAFCGQSDCTLSILYDQSGRGYDVPNTDPATQIKIYDGASQSLTTTNSRPVIRTIDPDKNLWQHEGLGLASNPALTVAYVGRFDATGPAADVAPIRIGMDDSNSSQANELAFSFQPGQDYIYFGSGGMGWPYSANMYLHRAMFMHGANQTIGTSSMLVEGQLISATPPGDAGNQTFDIGLGGSLLVGKHPSNQSGAIAEIQTLIIWNQFLAGEDAYTAEGGLEIGPDLCPEDPNKNSPGKCGCGVPEADPCVISTGPDDRNIPSATIVPVLDPAPPALLPGIEGTFSQADGVFTELHYAPVDAQHQPMNFCDEAGNPVPAPSEAELNAPPPENANCLGMVANTTDCPIDPSSLTTTACQTDADCPTGLVCGARCTDAQCTVLEHYCGQHAASCGGVGPETNCQDYTMCASDGAVSTPQDEQELHDAATAELTERTNAAQLSDADKTSVPDIQPVSQAELCFLSNDVAHLTDGTSKMNMGSPKKKSWDVYLEHNVDWGISPSKDRDWVTQLKDLHGTAKIAAGGVVFGNKIEALSAEAGATLTDCGLDAVASIKVFGEAIVALSGEVGHRSNLELKGPTDLGTSTDAKSSCESAKKLAKDTQTELRTANLFAREVYQYVKENSITPQLCNAIVNMVPDAEKDSLGDPYNCADIQNETASRKIDLRDWWKKEYDAKAASYLTYADAVGVANQKIETSGTIDLFDLSHPYFLQAPEVNLPIGPITLTLAIEAYGSWDIKGGIQYGIGYTSAFPTTIDNLSMIVGSAAEKGDLRALAGPAITPEVKVGVQAYVGVGVPGVTVGVEGHVDLVDVSLPISAVAVAMRVTEADRRDISMTDFAGTVKPGLDNKIYQWKLGYNFMAQLDLTELKGELDLAARLHILFFKKTFRMKLFGWDGFGPQHFNLVTGGGGSAIPYEGDLGKQGESLAYTEIVPITDPDPATKPSGPVPRVCQIAPD